MTGTENLTRSRTLSGSQRWTQTCKTPCSRDLVVSTRTGSAATLTSSKRCRAAVKNSTSAKLTSKKKAAECSDGCMAMLTPSMTCERPTPNSRSLTELRSKPSGVSSLTPPRRPRARTAAHYKTPSKNVRPSSNNSKRTEPKRPRSYKLSKPSPSRCSKTGSKASRQSCSRTTEPMTPSVHCSSPTTKSIRTSLRNQSSVPTDSTSPSPNQSLRQSPSQRAST